MIIKLDYSNSGCAYGKAGLGQHKVHRSGSIDSTDNAEVTVGPAKPPKSNAAAQVIPIPIPEMFYFRADCFPIFSRESKMSIRERNFQPRSIERTPETLRNRLERYYYRTYENIFIRDEHPHVRMIEK